jgi:hypothetical protein
MNYEIIKNWKNKKIYVDIDETICLNQLNRNYAKAKPIKNNIQKINYLSNDNEIIYWTARGTGTGINWEKVTLKQFEEWGVKFDLLKFGKPVYDIFIDDKNTEAKYFFNGN